MQELLPQYAAVIPGFVFLIAAAVCQWRQHRVPNSLCLGFLAGALATATAASADIIETQGGLGSCLIGLFTGGFLMIPFYAKRMLGAGCVKAQAVFGAWVGCGLPTATTITATFSATVLGAVLTLIAAMMAWDWLQSSQDNETTEFPAQVTLSAGTALGLCLFMLL